MTACAIAIQILDDPVVYIDSRYSETLGERFFDEDPIVKLEINQCQNEEDIKKL